MDPAEILLQKAMLRQLPIRKTTLPGDSTIQKFYEGSSIFVTGGSGFIGKLFIEKICRTCNVKNIYMLIRPKKHKSPQERLAEVLKDPAFESLYKEKPNFAEKIITVEGDITEIRLGLGVNDWNTLVNEVDMIFHIAANVRFEVNLQEAILCNVRGTREILTLGKSCTKLRAHVHVSTAYTFATNDRIGDLVLEEFQPGPADPEVIINMAETVSKKKLDDLTSELKKRWPNTYTFTKAIGEEAVRTMSDDLPICVVRPAIVIPTSVEPVPGWVDMSNVYGPSGLMLGLWMGVIHTIFSKKSVRIGFTPADLVTNAIIAAGWETGSRPRTEDKRTDIYTVSNIRNPILWGQTGEFVRKCRAEVVTPKALWYCETFETNSPFIFWLSTLLFHFIPAYLVDGICFLLGKERRFVKLYKKTYQLSHVLNYFTRHDWQFSDANTHRLFLKMSKSDQIIFNFDMATIDWPETIRIWLIGLRKFIIKDGLKDTNYGIMKQKILFIPHCLVLVLYCYLFIKMLLLSYVGFGFIFEHLFSTTNI